MLRVEIQGRHAELQTAAVQDWVNRCFPDIVAASLVVRLVGKAESEQLNSTFRGKAGPTNILSFPFDVPAGVPNDHLGDLVVCVPVLMQEAQQQGKSPQHHFAHLLIHGVLHLQGYDHLEDAEATEMENLEIKLLAGLGVSNPYQEN